MQYSVGRANVCIRDVPRLNLQCSVLLPRSTRDDDDNDDDGDDDGDAYDDDRNKAMTGCISP